MSNTNATTAQPEFGKVRAALWPIHMSEMKKFIPTGLMMFFILFNYTILRDAKDSLFVPIPEAGAEVIPFLKAVVVLPISILFVILYTKLANVLSRENLFYTIIIPFLIFFGLFAFYLYPNKELLHPDPASIQALRESMPRLQFLFPIYGLWTYSAFYALSELWGSIMISLMFWQFANEITRTAEAKRFYSFFGLIANIALILSGGTVIFFSKIQDKVPAGVDAWGVSLQYLMGAVIAAGILVIVIYRWMNTNVLTDPKYYEAAKVTGPKKSKKPKLSVMQSFEYLLTSRYLGFIALLVIGYGLSMGLIEIVWKKQVGILFPNQNDYGAFMGAFSASTGVVTIILIMLFKGIVRKFGWFTGAIITPLMILVTGVLFFSFVFFREEMLPLATSFGVTSVWMAVMIGATQNILSKGTKYSLFDPTKEMAYIPLDQELKVKGKAAVDVIGGRLGKGGSGWINLGLLAATASSSILLVLPYIMGIVGVIIFSWVVAVRGLSKRYHQLVTAKDEVIKEG